MFVMVKKFGSRAKLACRPNFPPSVNHLHPALPSPVPRPSLLFLFFAEGRDDDSGRTCVASPPAQAERRRSVFIAVAGGNPTFSQSPLSAADGKRK